LLNSPGTDQIEKLFPDLHPPYDARQATVEAHRCLNCFDAPCMGACPTHIDIPRFIKKIASGNVTGSARTILEANVLAASCSRVCPVEVLCEGACVMNGRGEKAIEIGRLQRFAMETYYDGGGRIPRRSSAERTERVACIGGGPASLACAAELRQRGFGVTIFDKRPLAGGLNTYGVAEYKLRAADSLREAGLIRDLGVHFIQRDIDAAAFDEIEREFDAVFLGVGLGEMNRLDVKGGATGVIDALEFIASYKTGRLTRSPARVVVIGAGNTAIDAACAAKRLGAVSSTIVYRRRQEQMSAFAFEYDHALREGVDFIWEAAPIALRETNGALEIECVRITAGASGRLAPMAGSNFTVACDLVIPAIGQSPLLTMLQQVRGVTLEAGRVVVDRGTGQTVNPRYFAGGDCVNGGREVVDAVADGKRAALGIAAMLGTRTEARVG
jgi:dihydropyrimidine dehydrogenase (NAD+) subunit PreT